MKLIVFTCFTTFYISYFLTVNGQFGNNGWNSGQQRNQYGNGNPLNAFMDGLKSQVATNLFQPNVYGGGYGTGLPQQQNPWATWGANQFHQTQGGYNNQYAGNPTYQNQHPYNQGQYNPNGYQQQGGNNFGPGQQYGGGSNFGPSQQGGANFGAGQQNFQGPQNANGQSPLPPRDNLAGQNALPIPDNTNSAVPSGNNVQLPNQNDVNAQPNVPIPVDTREELKPNVSTGENPPAGDTNSEDALVLKEFNNSS